MWNVSTRKWVFVWLVHLMRSKVCILRQSKMCHTYFEKKLPSFVVQSWHEWKCQCAGLHRAQSGTIAAIKPHSCESPLWNRMCDTDMWDLFWLSEGFFPFDHSLCAHYKTIPTRTILNFTNRRSKQNESKHAFKFTTATKKKNLEIVHINDHTIFTLVRHLQFISVCALIAACF